MKTSTLPSDEEMDARARAVKAAAEVTNAFWKEQFKKASEHNVQLCEALRLALSWIDNWSPSFTDEEEWDEDSKSIRATLELSYDEEASL